jgi:hypothetical protein
VKINAAYLSIFRFLFGIIMIPQVISLVPHIHDLSNSCFVFHYPGLSFIEAYSHELIDQLQFVSILSAIAISLGVYTRVFSAVFMLSFGYLFMIDMSFYNNHYYLWCLISFVFIFIDWKNSIQLKDLFAKNFKKEIAIENYFYLGLLFSIVYLYGGIAKLNSDWLQGQPMILLAESRKYAFPTFTGFLMCYFGLVFDLAVPFIAWKYLKKWWVLVPYIGFHVTNYFTFNIGEFPIVMIAALLVYWPIQGKIKFSDIKNFLFKNLNLSKSILTLFFVFQFIFPLKTFIMHKGIAWHRQGHFFSWRMMLHNHRPQYFQFKVVLKDRNDFYFVDFKRLLTYRQFHNAFHDQYFIWSLAQKLYKDAVKKYKTKNVQVYCKSLVTLNQHPPRNLIKSNIDLSKTNYHLFSKNTFFNY